MHSCLFYLLNNIDARVIPRPILDIFLTNGFRLRFVFSNFLFISPLFIRRFLMYFIDSMISSNTSVSVLNTKSYNGLQGTIFDFRNGSEEIVAPLDDLTISISS